MYYLLVNLGRSDRGCKKSPEKNEDTRKAKTSG